MYLKTQRSYLIQMDEVEKGRLDRAYPLGRSAVESIVRLFIRKAFMEGVRQGRAEVEALNYDKKGMKRVSVEMDLRKAEERVADHLKGKSDRRSYSQQPRYPGGKGRHF